GATTRAYMGLPSGRQVSFVDEDAELLTARIPELFALSREYSKRCSLTVGQKTINVRTRGVDPSFGPMRNIIPQAGGRFIDELDLADKRRGVVLGDELAKDPFGGLNPVGRTLAINQSSFLVVGGMRSKIMLGM